MDFYYPEAEGVEDWLEGEIKPVPFVFTGALPAKTSSDKLLREAQRTET